MKKNKILVLMLIITVALFSGCKVEFPEKAVNNSSTSTVEQSLPESSTVSDSSSINNNAVVTTTQTSKKAVSSSISSAQKNNSVSTEKPTDTQKIADQKPTVKLSISCKTILSNKDKLNKDKLSVLPKDGIIYPEREITFSEGQSVFDVLLRETKNRRIPMEFKNTPMYNTAYIEGINNIYQFDCGELSGWMYKVNGKFPNYGCSKYKLKNGDVIEWVFTCDQGRDVGGEWSENNG